MQFVQKRPQVAGSMRLLAVFACTIVVGFSLAACGDGVSEDPVLDEPTSSDVIRVDVWDSEFGVRTTETRLGPDRTVRTSFFDENGRALATLDRNIELTHRAGIRANNRIVSAGVDAVLTVAYAIQGEDYVPAGIEMRGRADGQAFVVEVDVVDGALQTRLVEGALSELGAQRLLRGLQMAEELAPERLQEALLEQNDATLQKSNFTDCMGCLATSIGIPYLGVLCTGALVGVATYCSWEVVTGRAAAGVSACTGVLAIAALPCGFTVGLIGEWFENCNGPSSACAKAWDDMFAGGDPPPPPPPPEDDGPIAQIPPPCD